MKQIESDDKGIPVLLSGNKEYFDIMTGIAGYSRKQLMEICDKGNAVYSKFERKRGNTKIESVSNKLTEMEVLLGLLHLMHSWPDQNSRMLLPMKYHFITI